MEKTIIYNQPGHQQGRRNGSSPHATRQSVSTIVVGGGQAGLATGYYLQKHGMPFIILDAAQRIGDSWRSRWDSLRLFTPARYNGLPGMPYPAPDHYFPTKDEMADFLEEYAKHFNLPVVNGVTVDSLAKERGKFVLTAGTARYEADHVVVAMSSYQKPRLPDFARQLDPAIYQIHSSEYRNPNQLREGDVLLVGAGNSGAEIAMELAKTRRVWISGRATGNVPFRIQTQAARRLFIPLLLRVIFHRVMTIDSMIGRKVRSKVLGIGGPLIRVKRNDLVAAGILTAPRMKGVVQGRPLLENDQILNVPNVIWCSGFNPGFEWIKLPVHGRLEPEHRGGVVKSCPGLYFVGLFFLYSMSSNMIQGVGRDARRIVEEIAKRMKSTGVNTEEVTYR